MDFKNITKLADIMSQFGLTKLEVTEKDMTISLAREATATVAPAVPVAPVPQSVSGNDATDDDDDDEMVFIKSPMPGTFYLSTSPEAAPFVKPGDSVHANSVVCIIEAMKVMNEIKAEINGKILRCLVENGAVVEYGQPLFEVSK